MQKLINNHYLLYINVYDWIWNSLYVTLSNSYILSLLLLLSTLLHQHIPIENNKNKNNNNRRVTLDQQYWTM